MRLRMDTRHTPINGVWLTQPKVWEASTEILGLEDEVSGKDRNDGTPYARYVFD